MGATPKRLNGGIKRVGHVWHGRYTSILVEKEAYLLERCRYIVLNPVWVQWVRQVHDGRWSSYRATVRGEGVA